MKTLIKLSSSLALCLMLIFANSANSQSCMSAVTKYSGPANTTQLTALLNTTNQNQYPLIVQLSTSMRASLETYMQFSSAGMPTGMSGADSNINSLYANTQYCSALFSEIFNQLALVSTYGNGPTITNITMSQFQQMTQNGVAFDGTCSWCVNCYSPIGSVPLPGQCCTVGGKGCCDEIVRINGNLYNVAP